MDEYGRSKFEIGDIVVIIKYGSVGKITSIKFVDGQLLYEVNESGGLFNENGIMLLADYKGELFDKEQIDIEYKFFFGDLVQVKGYREEIFKVVGFRTEIWRYQEDAWEDIIYELTRINDGEWLEADEAELILVADSEHADSFLKKFGFVYPIKKTKKPLNISTSKEQLSHKIDCLLDKYNDYKALYLLFQDDEYLSCIHSIEKQLYHLTIAKNKRLKKQ
ncbi:hypothetical protein [Heyndrickxia oleronia]|uniref:YodN n=1 Tax=Heyndrickxia oleronia TaxID=38875 RepID=A0AAW6SR87_9BACI|nr:hypothetical protein [Heyndrickxia oleronia]MDH5159750.1 hypothetical protein [Heyndrickxia oleronia]